MSAIPKELYAEIFEAGRKARHVGRGQLENPYYDSANVPAQTGDSIEVFGAKMEAWHSGWKLQNIIIRGYV